MFATGTGAALSHRSAAALRGMLPRPRDVVEVTRVRRRHGRPGIRVHNAKQLLRSDVRHVDGIPVTTPLRTLLDLAPTEHLEPALNEALIRRLVEREALLARATDRPGAARLRALLTDEPTPSRSELERMLLRPTSRPRAAASCASPGTTSPSGRRRRSPASPSC